MGGKVSKAKTRKPKYVAATKKHSRPSLKFAEKLQQLPWRLSTSAERCCSSRRRRSEGCTHTHTLYVTTNFFFCTSKSVEMLDFSVGWLFSLALLFVQISWNAAILHGANYFFGGVGGGTINAQNRKGQGSAQAQPVSVLFLRRPKFVASRSCTATDASASCLATHRVQISLFRLHVEESKRYPAKFMRNFLAGSFRQKCVLLTS